MFVDTTIYGYVTDGAAYHPGCEPDEVDASTDPTVKALFNWDLSEFADGGLSCDGCTEWIVEPDEVDGGTDDEPSDPYDSETTRSINEFYRERAEQLGLNWG